MYQRPVQAFNSRVTQVASSVTVVTLANEDTARLGCTIFNDSTATLTVKLGPDASVTSFTVEIAAGGYYEVPFGYVAIITGLWDAANGFAYVTELR